MEVSDYIRSMGERARAAAVSLARLSTEEKNAILGAVADALEARRAEIVAANDEDVKNAKAAGISPSMVDRLTLTDARFDSMVGGVRHVASLPDPVGETIWERDRPSGIKIRKVRVPFGVVAVVFESRPNVFVDTAALCLKTGNATILRGGKEAILTNRVLAAAVTAALAEKGVESAVQLVDILDHAAVTELVRAVGLVDVAIPRGGERLIRAMCEAALVPVLKHYKGVCHIYVDETADFDMALRIVDNAKTQRPGVCNAAECLLVNEKIAADFLPRVEAWAKEKGVTLHYGSKEAVDWGREFLALEMNVGVVRDCAEAVVHINANGSHHSDCIVTEDAARAAEFLRDVDSAAVYHNVSTRFTDGAEFGMGAEIGISTDKLHARGPMGLEELTMPSRHCGNYGILQSIMTSDNLLAISPIDGRYASKCAELRDVFSEYGLIRRRVLVECTWLEALCGAKAIRECKPLSAAERKALRGIAASFSVEDAARVKEIERTTNHDVKAVEYFLKEKVRGTSLESRSEFIHFACTSEDINNMSHALMLRDGKAVLRAAMDELTDKVASMAKAWAKVPMLAHTHGQPASPTTVGKELAVVCARLRRQAAEIDRLVMPAKMNGAVGNFNAHLSAYPDVDWEKLSRGVIESLGLRQNRLTTQIEPHDGIAELFDAVCRWNSVLLDFDRDVWTYVSMGYFRQRTIKGEVGSSTMPHKVNPIDFENSEGNLGLANAVMGFMARKLAVSRMQRDLTDSTTLRNMGVGFGYTLIAVRSTMKGLGKLELNEERLAADLDSNWEVLAEPIQTVMRKVGMDHPYERLKELTRGRRVTPEILRDFVKTLPLPKADRDRLMKMTPATYTGIAAKLARLA